MPSINYLTEEHSERCALYMGLLKTDNLTSTENKI